MTKQVVLILSRLFPLYHSKKRERTNFRANLENGIKIHTIRANYDQWKHNLDKVIDGDFICSVREWTGRPYNSKQKEFKTYTGKQIGYQRITMTYDPATDELKAIVDGKPVWDIHSLAQNDGLPLRDFKEWMFGAKKTAHKQIFTGIIIHFTNFRY